MRFLQEEVAVAAKNDEKRGPPPLENRKVKVDAHPNSRGGAGNALPYAGKVDKNLKREIEDAMDEADPDVVSQIEAAKEAVNESKGQVDPNLVDIVDVEVTGDVDGERKTFDLTYFPGMEDDEDD